MHLRLPVLLLLLLGSFVRADEEPAGLRQRLVVPEDGEGVLWSVAFSPDGKTIACGGSLKRIHLFDVASGELLRSFGSHPDNVWTVAWSPDGKLLCSGGRADLTLRAWDPARGEELTPFEGHRGGITRIRFFRDGQRLIMAGGSWDPVLRIWDVAQRQQLRTLSGHTNLIDAMDLAAHGRLAITGSRDGTLRLWELTRGHEIYQQRSSGEAGYLSVAFSPDGRLFAFGTGDGRFEIRETITRRRCLPVAERNRSVRAIAFSPDGRLVAFTSDTWQIRLWDTRTAREVRTFTGHRGPIYALDFSPDGRLLASSAGDSTIILWDVPAPEDLSRSLTDQERRIALMNLGSENPVAARHAVVNLSIDPAELPPAFVNRLQPAEAGDQQAIDRWVSLLGSVKYAEREHAMQKLEHAGEQSLAALRRAWSLNASLEQRRRIKRLLDRLESEPVRGELLWQLRAVAVLEARGNSDARRRLRTLAAGAEGMRLTLEARDALDRLGR